MLLAKWNYTQAEWKSFSQWKTREKGLIYYLFYSLKPAGTRQVPEVRIADDRVWFNDWQEPFQNSRCRFLEIRIREEVHGNVLEISYQSDKKMKGIKVPIPKGKLREAFEVQERLLLDGASVG